MSQENVDIVRRATALLTEAYKSGEPTDELLAQCAPDIHVDSSRRVFNPATYDGHAGLRGAIREIWQTWEDFHEENQRLIGVGNRVLGLQTIAGRGRASGVEVKAPGALIWTLRDGLVTRVETFWDQAEAAKPSGWRTRARGQT